MVGKAVRQNGTWPSMACAAEDKGARRHMWGRCEKVGAGRHSAQHSGGQGPTVTSGRDDWVTSAV
jgi:hypothetical protein